MSSKTLHSSLFSGAALLCLLNGAVFAGQTTQINASPDKYFSDGRSPAISADGRYVAFTSYNSNTVVGDTNRTYDVFVYDNITHKKTRVSVASSGEQGNDASIGSEGLPGNYLSLSADGRYVAFPSYASNFVKGDTNDSVDMFVHDRLTHKTERVSVASNGNQVKDDDMGSVSLSADGRYVAFSSAASGLVEGDTNKCVDIFVHDRLTHNTERVSVDSTGQQQLGKPAVIGVANWIGEVNISADGRYVVFVSDASNLVTGDTNNKIDVFVHDRIAHKTERVSVDKKGMEWKKNSDQPSISANGRYVAYRDYSDGRDDDFYVYDRLTHKTEQGNVLPNGKPAPWGTISTPMISGNGRYIAFADYSDYYSAVANDTNESPDFFIVDRLTHKTERVSVASNGNQGKGWSNHGAAWSPYEIPSISADGRYVVFNSYLTNLVPKDTTLSRDIFIRDRLLDATHHANLQITAATKPTTLKPNAKGDYLYTIINNGKDIVPDVSLIHLVSGGSAVSFKPSQGTCSPSAVETVCHLGKLAAGQKLTLQATVKAQRKSVNQQITVSGAPVDTVPANNQISVSTPVK